MIVQSFEDIKENTKVANSTATKNSKRNKENTLPRFTANKYLELLALGLKTCKKVTKNEVLKADLWTKSGYNLLAKIMNEDLNKNMDAEDKLKMGTSLSSKTLQKIVSKTYKIKYPIDPRTLNTLHKVVLFLEYENWDDFVAKVNVQEQKKQQKLDPEEEIRQIVEEAVRREHLVYCQLPEIKEDYLTSTFIKNSPSYNMVMDVLVDKAEKKQIISNHYNPSTCEILDIEVKKIEEDYAQVYTKEYWLLCWWDTSKKRYVKRYKDISDHFYILHKKAGCWKIKTNASTSDPMELE